MSREGRDFKSPKYKAFRRAVLKRDGYRCKFPGCKSRRKLQTHHIRRVADEPLLERAVRNGITLCRKHHDMITGNEGAYVAMFSMIVSEGAQDIMLDLILGRDAEADS